ncbi:MAG: hypothetical protein IT426_09565 [Pirellulales bacterium]|nr:hypothetical protein [Pirellulales bacterium]
MFSLKEVYDMDADREHLRLLSIFHYILSGLMAIMSCLPILQLAMGIRFLNDMEPFNVPDIHMSSDDKFFSVFHFMMIFIPSLMIVLGWTYAFCLFLAGKFLQRHAHLAFCFTVAAVSCLFVPMGTVLGVFTIVVLSRSSVKRLFNVKSDSFGRQ